jgi:hypothetical protein
MTMCITPVSLMGWTLGLLPLVQRGPRNMFMAAVLKKGGAEGWLQVELDERYDTLPNVAWVQREQAIYNNPNERVDFVIKCDGGPQTCVELKVETLFASADQGRLTMPHNGWKAVQADVDKLRLNRKPDFSGQPAFVVAMVWSNEAIGGMNQWLATSGLTGNSETYGVDHAGETYPVTVYVIVVS